MRKVLHFIIQYCTRTTMDCELRTFVPSSLKLLSFCNYSSLYVNQFTYLPAFALTRMPNGTRIWLMVSQTNNIRKCTCTYLLLNIIMNLQSKNFEFEIETIKYCI